MSGTPASPSPAPLPQPPPAQSPRVLVADDDPASCRFLCDGFRTLGAQAQSCMDGKQALALAHAEAFDLLLLDCRMPHAGALQVLAALRADSQARSTASIAVASSAEVTPTDRRQLLDAGFAEVLLKPCTLIDLRRLLALLPGPVAMLDDALALDACGDATTLRALRQLLGGELALLHQELDTLSHDGVRFNERLHRLRSSCGFCGATALSAEVTRLQRQLAHHPETDIVALARFREVLLETLQALDR